MVKALKLKLKGIIPQKILSRCQLNIQIDDLRIGNELESFSLLRISFLYSIIIDYVKGRQETEVG